MEVIFANDCRVILDYTKNVLTCDIHSRARSKRLLLAAGAERVCGLDDIMTASVDGSGAGCGWGCQRCCLSTKMPGSASRKR